ncbi:MAG: arginine--tRNA ligase, partial [Candidatus Sungbacteria bacterium]|nr:arginine--tRNA ligase [Candidatus Sungbacteria bacterium]
MMREQIHALIQDAVTREFGVAGTPDFSVVPPEDPLHGDYATNVAMVIAKTVRSNPMEVAERIKNAIAEHELIGRIEVAKPGFVNIFLENDATLHTLGQILENAEVWGVSDIGRGKTVMLDYFQLNIAKRPHIGHIRSAIIGDALKRMFASQGYHAVSDTHVGDWGTQFGILLLGYKETGASLHKEVVGSDPFGALEKIYLAENARIKDDPDRRERAKQEFAKLEQGDQENREIWQWMVDISMKNLETSAARLGLLPFDEHRGESFYEDKMAAIVELALKKGIAKKTEDGAVIVDLTHEKLDEAVLIKSDGASTYLLRDLATIRYRKEQWNFWKNLYVVDVRQSHHFKQAFRVAELLGFEGVGESEHVSYGFVKLPEGMLSTRAGNVIALEKVLDEAIEKARSAIKDKNPDLSGSENVARAVGIGALKYFDLSHHRASDIVFSWDRALSFDGNTGPYLQYTYARLKSILRKSQITIRQPADKSQIADINVEMDALERYLAVLILRFPEAIEDALAIYSPHVLAAYLYDLAKS